MGYDTTSERYYHKHDTTKKDSRGYPGIYTVIDRETGEEIQVFDMYGQAESKCKELNRKEKLKLGIKIPNDIEVAFSHSKNKTATEVVPVVVHRL